MFGQRLDFPHQRLLLLLELLLTLLRLFLEAGHGLVDLTGDIGITLSQCFIFFQYLIDVTLQLSLLGPGSAQSADQSTQRVFRCVPFHAQGAQLLR
ncbi:hypothetical protein D3C80_1170970 [compost metagenome]